MEFENLMQLIQAVSDSSLTGLKYDDGHVKLNLRKEKRTETVTQDKGARACAAVSAPSDVRSQEKTAGDTGASGHPVPASAEREGQLIQSPLVGTFYAAAAEDAAPFVSVGDKVKKGQVMAIVEAMKLMNDIESDYDGTVAEILAANGDIVEYGQPLFRIVP